MVRCSPITIAGPLKWSQDASIGLKDTFFGFEQMIAEGVNSGRMQLWRINDDSWLVTEIFRNPDFLMVWCYQGSGLVNLMMHLNNVALSNNLPELRFFTRLRAAVRALRFMRPVVEPGNWEGEIFFKIEAKRYECERT